MRPLSRTRRAPLLAPLALGVCLACLAAACGGGGEDPSRLTLPAETPSETTGGAASPAESTSPTTEPVTPTAPEETGLSSPPGGPQKEPLAPGLHPITARGEEGRIYVSRKVAPGRPAPLMIFLHGAGGGFGRGISLYKDHAERHGAVLVDPVGGLGAWEPVLGDVVGFVFDRFDIDRSHILLVGFSDGASSSLSVGLTNGDVFSHVAAMSPGFMSVDEYRGKPRVFIAHGRDDPVLSFQNSSQDIVPTLEDRGYDVTFLPFDGKHETPPWIAARIAAWFFA